MLNSAYQTNGTITRTPVLSYLRPQPYSGALKCSLAELWRQWLHSKSWTTRNGPDNKEVSYQTWSIALFIIGQINREWEQVCTVIEREREIFEVALFDCDYQNQSKLIELCTFTQVDCCKLPVEKLPTTNATTDKEMIKLSDSRFKRHTFASREGWTWLENPWQSWGTLRRLIGNFLLCLDEKDTIGWATDSSRAPGNRKERAGERSSNSNCVLSFCQPGDINVAIMAVTQYMQAETHLSHSERIAVSSWQSQILIKVKAGPPLIWVLVIFDFFAPWYRRSWEASSVKIL